MSEQRLEELENGDWNQWRKLVWHELNRQGAAIDSMRDQQLAAIRAQLTVIEVNIGILKTKAAIAGASMGAIVGAAISVAFRLL